MNSRYTRQTCLAEVGAAGQAKLAAARILIIGAGGLAAPVLPILTAAGVGQITILDHDRVEISNLHRQTLFTESDCGRTKAVVAARRCRELNRNVGIRPVVDTLTPANAAQWIGTADIVLDCADSYAAAYTLSDTCLSLGIPLISASVLGLRGYVGGFCGTAPSLRAVFPHAPESGASCATAGVLGSVVAMIGATQAHMALAVLLGMTPSPLGQLVQMDAQQYSFTRFRFDGAAEPEQIFRFIALSDLREDDLIVELRSVEEAPTPIHPKARRILPAALASAELAPEKRLVLCCAGGLRAWRSAEALHPHRRGETVLIAASACTHTADET